MSEGQKKNIHFDVFMRPVSLEATDPEAERLQAIVLASCKMREMGPIDGFRLSECFSPIINGKITEQTERGKHTPRRYGETVHQEVRGSKPPQGSHSHALHFSFSQFNHSTTWAQVAFSL